MPDVQFNKGDIVFRTGPHFGPVRKGGTYTVKRQHGPALYLEGHDVSYTAKNFVLEKAAPAVAHVHGTPHLPPDDRLLQTKQDILTDLAMAQEADPTGRAQNAPGAKMDAGKLLPRLVLGEFAHALEAVAEVGTVGARKYTPKGWLSVPNGEERYAEAAMRHQLEVWKGNPVDNGPGGTGKLHKAQVIWNLLAELELELRNAKQA